MIKRDKYLDEHRARLAAGLVAFAMRVPVVEILEMRRGPAEAAHARQIAMYIVYVGCGISLARVAAAFNRDRSTVSYACQQIEDRRDDIEFDRWLEELEGTLQRAEKLGLRADVAA